MNKKKIIKKLDSLISESEEVLNTHTPNPDGWVGFPTLGTEKFQKWRNSCENLIKQVTGRESSYYKNFKEQVERGKKSDVKAGRGILKSIKSDIKDNTIDLQENESENGNLHKKYFSYLINSTYDWFERYRNKIIVGILVGVIAPLILYYFFGIK
ncbi:MAG: hypothetical protein ABEJ02_02625 [Candidatus Paceibacteria bacterium]